jgi:hypothetical protein
MAALSGPSGFCEAVAKEAPKVGELTKAEKASKLRELDRTLADIFLIA